MGSGGDGGRTVCLAVIGIGDEPAAASYLRGLERAAKATGVEFRFDGLPDGADQELANHVDLVCWQG